MNRIKGLIVIDLLLIYKEISPLDMIQVYALTTAHTNDSIIALIL